MINESSISALPHLQYEVKYYNTSKKLLHNLDNDSFTHFSNYSKRSSNKEKDMEHLQLERYATVNLFVQYPILFPHHTQQFVNASEYNASNSSVVEQDDAPALSSIWQLPFLNDVVYDHLSYLHPSKQYMKNLYCTQNTNMTMPINSFFGGHHLLLKSSTHNQTLYTN